MTRGRLLCLWLTGALVAPSLVAPSLVAPSLVAPSLVAPSLVAPSLAADETKPAAKQVEIHFLNGSIVRLAVQSETLEVATRYGKLTVPIEEIRAIDFGLHFPEGTAGQDSAGGQTTWQHELS